MQGGAKFVDDENLCKTGLMNLCLALLNMDPKTVVDYQARIDSDCNLVTTLIKTITPAELEKLQVHGRELDKKYGLIYGETTLFESKQGIFATDTDGANTSIFTENDDKLLVIYYYTTCSVYIHDDDKWETIAFYMGKFDGHQCHRQMKTLLQNYPRGCIFNLFLQQFNNDDFKSRNHQ